MMMQGKVGSRLRLTWSTRQSKSTVSMQDVLLNFSANNGKSPPRATPQPSSVTASHLRKICYNC